MVANRIIRGVRIWAALTRMGFRAEMQYRTNFVVGMFGGIVAQCSGLAFIGVILHRFETIGGWSLSEIMLLYGLRLTAHALWAIPFGAVFQIHYVLREGEFDRYLTRPANPLIQLLTRRLAIVTVGHLLAGLVILVIGALSSNVNWTPPYVLLLATALIGGALIEMSVQLMAASLAFRMRNTTELMLTFDSVFNSFGNYPTKIFGPVARWGMTAVFPLAFAAYFPAAVLLNRVRELWVPVEIAAATLVVGVVLILIAYRFWRSQIPHYTSSGT
jgi:ABC-2 type transport system permease protein